MNGPDPESFSDARSESLTRDDILNAVRANDRKLRALGVRELALFGSFARGEASETSDVDFLVDFDVKSFDNYMGTRELLQSILSRRVDLVVTSSLKARLRDRILAEAIRAA